MSEWINDMLNKGYTISPRSDLKEFADKALQKMLLLEEPMNSRDLSAED